MHDLALAVPVRQVEADEVETGRLSESVGAILICSVAEADEQGSFVEPKQVAALGEGGSVQRCGHRQVRSIEIDTERRRLAPSARLARPQQYGAVIKDQHRVVDVDRIRVVLDVRRGEDHLGSGGFEQLAERLVLASDSNRIRLSAPAVLAPELEIL